MFQFAKLYMNLYYFYAFIIKFEVIPTYVNQFGSAQPHKSLQHIFSAFFRCVLYTPLEPFWIQHEAMLVLKAEGSKNIEKLAGSFFVFRQICQQEAI